MKQIRTVFIIGWYGTETVGDKAILGGILEYYRQQNPQVTFAIASFYPFVTLRTMYELNESADVFPVYSAEFVKRAATSDVAVMGGGPLMDLEELSIPLRAFWIARLFGKQRVVFGCGLGPLTKPRYQSAVQRILRLATDIRLRDSQSVAMAKKYNGVREIELIQDPAIEYVAKRGQALEGQKSVEDNDVMVCFLRDWPRQYAGDLSDDDYQEAKEKFERNLAECLQTVCIEKGLQIVLYPMQSFVVGGDDRVFARQFIDKYFDHSVRVCYDNKPNSVDDILLAMLNARVCVCMRYHSVLFAHTLHRPYVAIDYSSRGKIYSFMQDINDMPNYVSIFDLTSGTVDQLTNRLKFHLQAMT